jgi:hypothetical protein
MKPLLVIVPLTIVLAGCSRPQTSSPQNAGGVDPVYKRALIGHFLMDADYLGTEIALTTGATDVSLNVLHAMRSGDLRQVLGIINTLSRRRDWCSRVHLYRSYRQIQTLARAYDPERRTDPSGYSQAA